MPLTEMVEHQGLEASVRGRVLSFINALDKLPLPVQSRPGFLVNRVLTPYLMEAFLAYAEGVKPEVIDRAAVDFGMPMGPIELADTVGLDICLHVADTLKAALDRPLPDPSRVLRNKVELGELGRKTGKGFYVWKSGKPVKERDAPQPMHEMSDRLILPMLDVCVACLREGVVADEDTVDGAMIFATGFAPFRGGPMHYAKSRGAANIRRELERLSERLGDRFRPDPGWDRWT
jgi:3-hydroxyacyl-CoA dehydrogenase/enoyl-CoA hydratase/3-hydroxybutyryl-CoA epimerase